MLSGPKPPASGRRAEVTGGRASMRMLSLEIGGDTVDGQGFLCGGGWGEVSESVEVSVPKGWKWGSKGAQSVES